MNDESRPLERPRHHHLSEVVSAEPVEIPRLAVTDEFRTLMRFFASRAPEPHAETFRKLSIDWSAESDEAAA